MRRVVLIGTSHKYQLPENPAAAEMLRRMRIFFQIVQDRTTWPLQMR